jgi:hypothetical protein
MLLANATIGTINLTRPRATARQWHCFLVPRGASNRKFFQKKNYFKRKSPRDAGLGQRTLVVIS